MSTYQPIEVACACGRTFTWTVGEQKFMDSLLADGKVTEVRTPKRCPECRKEKRAKYADKKN